jgi:hypothetical protein
MLTHLAIILTFIVCGLCQPGSLPMAGSNGGVRLVERVFGPGSPSVPVHDPDTSISSCEDLLSRAEIYRSDGTYQRSYDTSRKYIEHCAVQAGAYREFTAMNGDVQWISESSNAVWISYRNWLKSVLYLNTVDKNYYCEDVNSILTSFQYRDPQRGVDLNGELAVLKYLKENSLCPLFTKDFDTIWSGTRDLQRKIWSDTVKDTNATPFAQDTVLPTLDDIGLAILRGPNADVVPRLVPMIGPSMTGLRTIPNPFASETRILFTCPQAAAIRFEVLDILGKRVYDGGERVFDTGENRIVLPGDGLPNGLLYARFSMLDGTVRTIKIRRVE